jgi:hypothetical protein
MAAKLYTAPDRANNDPPLAAIAAVAPDGRTWRNCQDLWIEIFS